MGALLLLLSHIWLFAALWIAACQAFLSITISWTMLRLMYIELVMLFNHLILCCPPCLLPSIFPSIAVFSLGAVWASNFVSRPLFSTCICSGGFPHSSPSNSHFIACLCATSVIRCYKHSGALAGSPGFQALLTAFIFSPLWFRIMSS